MGATAASVPGPHTVSGAHARSLVVVGATRSYSEASVQAGQTSGGAGMVVNSSRAILYAGQGEDFADRARAVAQATRDEINRYRLR